MKKQAVKLGLPILQYSSHFNHLTFFAQYKILIAPSIVLEISHFLMITSSKFLRALRDKYYCLASLVISFSIKVQFIDITYNTVDAAMSSIYIFRMKAVSFQKNSKRGLK